MTDPDTSRTATWRARLARPSTLGGRLALFAGIAVFIAVFVSGSAAFGAISRVLRDEIDVSLRSGGGRIGVRPPQNQAQGAQLCSGLQQRTRTATSGSTMIQVLAPSGSLCTAPGESPIVVLPGDRAVARRGSGDELRDGGNAAGQRLRVLVRPLPAGYAVLVSRDLSEVDTVLNRLRGILALFSVIGALVAIGLGLLVAKAGLRPLDRLTAAAEAVARTQNLDVHLDALQREGRDGHNGRDEVSRLARAFNSMIVALAAARARQSQLVADAGHELRTPLTSLRTNVELLVRSDRQGRALPPGQRAALLTSVTGQLEELSDLVGDLVTLADEQPLAQQAPLRLDDVVCRAVERARRRAGERQIDCDVTPWELDGDAAMLERAVVNVLDNAVKFSPSGSKVCVDQAGGVIRVSDQGPGVSAEDRDRVFDRFWRSAEARGLPGRGLGLAIVADAVALHDGTATIGGAPGGGAVVTLSLPGRLPPP